MTRAVDIVKSVCMAVGSLVCTIQPFDHLLEMTEFFGDLIIVGKSDDLCDAEEELFTELVEELLRSQRICTVSVSNETEVLGKFYEMPESHAHNKDAGTGTTVIGYLITDDGSCCGIQDEPDVGLDVPDLDVSFIGGESAADTVIVVVNERLDTDGGSLTIVDDLLMEDEDDVKVFQGL